MKTKKRTKKNSTLKTVNKVNILYIYFYWADALAMEYTHTTKSIYNIEYVKFIRKTRQAKETNVVEEQRSKEKRRKKDWKTT